MKLKALLFACAVAGISASFALADDGHGKHGKHHSSSTTATTATTATTTGTTTTTTTTAAGCSQVELRGTLASVAANSFTLTVQRAETGDDDDDDGNAAANPLVGQTVTVAVDPSTRVSFKATGKLIGPNVGDTAKVNALSCGTSATLTARSVKAQGAMAATAAKTHDSSNKHGKSHK